MWRDVQITSSATNTFWKELLSSRPWNKVKTKYVILNDTVLLNRCIAKNKFQIVYYSISLIYTDVVFWFNFILSCTTFTKYCNPYCVILKTLSVQSQRYWVSEIQEIQWFAVSTAASIEECLTSRYETLTTFVCENVATTMRDIKI